MERDEVAEKLISEMNLDQRRGDIRAWIVFLLFLAFVAGMIWLGFATGQ